MQPFYTHVYGNSVSLHTFGQRASRALEKSRELIADLIRAKPEEIIFTASSSESNNLALKGIAWANKQKGNHIIISSVEHDCIIQSARWLETQGFTVTRLPVDRYGFVDPKDVAKAIQGNTILVSVMHANNEIGTIEPIREIGRICRERNVLFHTDATQSFGKIPLDVEGMHVDLLTAASHKIYGAKGAALLYCKKGTNISPLLHGGGHESGLRSSTVNVPAIIGFAKAVDLCQKEMAKEGKRLTLLRDMLIHEILTTIPGSYLNGPKTKRLPNNVNVRFDFVEGEAIVMQLDSYGIAASTGSACSSPTLEPSHVLLATGLKKELAHGSLRLSLGRWTTKKEVKELVRVLPIVIGTLRKISPFKGNYV
jgi:cysteine desulfurase